MTSDKAMHEHNLLQPADLAAELERAREDVSAERDRYIRLLADFKNYRHRIERDGHKLAQAEVRGIMLRLLDMIDDVDRALQHTKAMHDPHWQGVQAIHQKFIALLEAYDVHTFDSVGKQFDQTLHNAVAVAARGEHASGTIVRELRRGYLWKGEILRPSEVQVAE